MESSLKTWYRHYGRQGSANARLRFTFSSDNIAERDRIAEGIRKLMAPPPPEIQERQPAVGFGLHAGSDDE